MLSSLKKSSLAPSQINLNKNSALFQNYQTFVSNPKHSVILQFYMGTFYLLPRLQLPPASFLLCPSHIILKTFPGMFSYSEEGTSFSLGAFTWPGWCMQQKKLTGLPFYFSLQPMKGKHINSMWVFLSVQNSESLHFFTAPSTPAVFALKIVFVFQLK